MISLIPEDGGAGATALGGSAPSLLVYISFSIENIEDGDSTNRWV